MKGIICLWGGAIVDIPAGWHICDGNDGTPDLRDRFVVGAGNSYAVDDSGGAASHTHGFTGDGHIHSIPNTNACPGAAANLCLDGTDTGSTAAAGTTDSEDSRPPYYALAYIIKL